MNTSDLMPRMPGVTTRWFEGLPAAILGLSVGLAPASLDAASLTEQTVRAGVETWVRYVTADARADAMIERMEPAAADGRTFAYVAHLAGGGYCLCSADDRLLPVYLYSPQGKYDADNPNNQYILGEIRSRLDALRKAFDRMDPALKQYEGELSRRSACWQDLISGALPAQPQVGSGGGGPVTLVLPLTSQWNQDSPYNDQCPNLTPGQDERTLVGCVATAMSQIMYYWKWPAAGTGTVPTPYPYKYRFATTWLAETLTTNPNVPVSWNTRLRWDTTGGGTLWMTGYWDEESVYPAAQRISADSAYRTALGALWNRMTPGQTVPNVNLSTPINWSVITDNHTDPADAGDAAVAALCYEVGVSVYMHYGLWLSSAFDYHIADELKEHFSYDSDAVWRTASDVTNIVEELQWFRVVELGGGGPPLVPGGHAWVAYGYNRSTTPTQLLMNLGWSGTPPASWKNSSGFAWSSWAGAAPLPCPAATRGSPKATT